MSVRDKSAAWAAKVEELFLRSGIKSVTMDDVAAHLGISKKTLYQFVQSKDELVMRVLERHISRKKIEVDNLVAAAENAIDESLKVLEYNIKDLGRMTSNLVHDLYKYHHKAWMRMYRFQHDYMVGRVAANIHRGRSEGLYREDFDADLMARLHLASSVQLFNPEWFPFGAYSRGDILKAFIHHYLFGIASADGMRYLQEKLNAHA